ncbi:MAG: cysteinyl-tRNA synthetase [Thermoplasmata archaeon]|jgi:cysteinyl-tRNA synthetase|nr:cysteinyl-tRNA synthetase [Thermoplasmata archaeon]
MLQVTNTLTGKKEPFAPLQPPQVRMYVCGLTPYEEAHIGHARAYVAYDVMKRYLAHKGLAVQHIQNITDVDDRILARAHERGEQPLAYAERIHNVSLEAFDKLRIRRAQSYPKVSEHIAGIVAMTEALIARHHAYAGKDEHGTSVYFSVESDPDYGKLSHLNRDELLQGVRKDVAEGKRHPADFALWKATKPNEGVSWDSPWGRGRPGWHIECSVMAKSLLGETLDIHGGGWDLIFPHHENELAQSESANGKPFVKYWLHVGFLTVEGVKMSKSLGNFTTLNAALAEWKPEALRLWFAGTHYRSPIDYSLAALGQAAKNIERFTNMLHNARSAKTRDNEAPHDAEFLALVAKRAAEFDAAMDDDLNTPKALATLFDLASDINKYVSAGPQKAALDKGLATFHKMEQIFDVLPAAEEAVEDAAPLLDLLLELRQDARKRKDFAQSDRIRDRLAELGYVIEDSANGPRWRKK